MVGFIIAGVVLFYFCILWPNFEGLPPRSHRVRRQRLAGKLGLHDKPSVILLKLDENDKNTLVNYMEFYDMTSFKTASNSQYFYLVENRGSFFSLYCSTDNMPPEDVDFNKLQNIGLFMHVSIQDFILERFLREYLAKQETKS